MARFTAESVKRNAGHLHNPEINARRGASVRAAAEARRANKPITEQLINELKNIDPTTQMSQLRLVVKALVGNAMGGDNLAIKEIFDRVEGKPKQQVDVSHDGEVSVRSAALSVLDQIFEDVLRADTLRGQPNALPDRPVLVAPLCLSEERSGEPVDLCEVSGGSGEP